MISLFPLCSPGATSLALGPLADRLNRVNLLLAVVILGSVPCALIKLLGFFQEKCSVGYDSARSKLKVNQNLGDFFGCLT